MEIGDWAASLGPVSDTERAVHGESTGAELGEFLSAWAQHRLGSAIAEVLFRAGRIDAVWAVQLRDGCEVVIKAHRPPVHLESLQASLEAQQILVTAGFPCPAPLTGPDEAEGRILTAETFIAGQSPDGRQPAVRQLLAKGLHGHIDLLRGHPDLTARCGPGPSWCQHQSGPWPVPHDTLVDFSSTPAGFGWLDAFAGRAADQISAHRGDDAVVVGHADWYAGNTAVLNDQLVGVYDWQLVADTEAVIAGFAASCYASSATGGGGLSTPVETAAFLQGYEQARGQQFTQEQRRAAAGAAAWILAFNARWQVALIEHDLCDHNTIALVRDHQEDYLGLSWN